MRPTNYPFYSTTQSVFGVFVIKGGIRQEGFASVRLGSGKQAHLGTELDLADAYLSGAFAKFMPLLAAQQCQRGVELDAAAFYPRQRDAYGHSSRPWHPPPPPRSPSRSGSAAL
jgi:hypothetical protein